jgi:hypothetical protein
MISRSMSKMLMIAVAAGVCAGPVSAKTPTPSPVPTLGKPVLGTGGSASNGKYQLRSSSGQWEVNIVRLTASNGYDLDGGLWANVSTPACGTGPSWTLPYCH